MHVQPPAEFADRGGATRQFDKDVQCAFDAAGRRMSPIDQDQRQQVIDKTRGLGAVIDDILDEDRDRT